MSRPRPIEEMVRRYKSNHTPTHLFKIDNYKLIKDYEIETVESTVFDLGGHKWKLYVNPSGIKNGNYVAIFLENQSPINVMLEYQLSVVNQLEPKSHLAEKQEFGTSSKPKKEGTSSLISIDDLVTKGYLVEDCCMFSVRLFGIGPRESGTAECVRFIEKPPPQHKFAWKIENFSKSFNTRRDQNSEQFVIGNRKWRILVQPRQFRMDFSRRSLLSLKSEGFVDNAIQTSTFAKFNLRIYDQSKKNRHLETTFSGWLVPEPRPCNGIAPFKPLEELKEPYMKKDRMYLQAEFEIISETTLL